MPSFDASRDSAPAGDFWAYLDRLVAENRLVVDRPRGSRHPRYPSIIYPVSYGYLEGTTAADGGGIDVWVGAAAEEATAGAGRPPVVGIICTVDLKKRDAEIKILLGCSEEEAQTILGLHNEHWAMRGWLVRRPPAAEA